VVVLQSDIGQAICWSPIRYAVTIIGVGALRNVIVGALLIASLCGCATSGGVTYSDYMEHYAHQSEGRGRVVLLREGAGIDHLSARIEIDGLSMGKADPGTFVSFDVEPGVHSFSADQRTVIGSCQVSAEIAAGKEYYFLVETRTSALVSGMLLGLVGTAVDSLVAGECSGTFSIKPIDSEQAKALLADLSWGHSH